MEQKTFYLNLKDRPYEAIKRGTKKIEVRANKNGSPVAEMKVGDTIIFTKCGTKEKQRCTILKLNWYQTVRELLINEGTAQTLSSGNDLEGGIKSIESIPGYKRAIAENGVFAVVLYN